MDNSVSKAPKKNNRTQKNLIVAGIITAVVILIGVFIVCVVANPNFNFNFIVNMFFKPSNVDQSNSFGNALSGDDGQANPQYNVVMSEDVYNFLIVGHDRAASLADVAMIVNFNVADGTVRIMQIPRDTYVSYDNYWYYKINGVVRYYSDENAEDPKMEGIAGYAGFLEKNLCIKIHYYAIMDLDQFVSIVDAIGGVEIDVPYDMKYHDPNQNLVINLKAGKQVLDGKQSEQFVRYRATFMQGDIGRVNMQKVFMAALFKSVQNNVNITNIGPLCNIIVENLTTNMSASDMIYFANYAFKVNLKNVTMMTLPGVAGSGADGLSYYNMNREATLNYVNTYFNIYDTDITDDIFDADRVFNSGSYIYYAPAQETDVYDAESLTDGEVPPT